MKIISAETYKDAIVFRTEDENQLFGFGNNPTKTKALLDAHYKKDVKVFSGSKPRLKELEKEIGEVKYPFTIMNFQHLTHFFLSKKSLHEIIKESNIMEDIHLIAEDVSNKLVGHQIVMKHAPETIRVEQNYHNIDLFKNYAVLILQDYQQGVNVIGKEYGPYSITDVKEEQGEIKLSFKFTRKPVMTFILDKD